MSSPQVACLVERDDWATVVAAQSVLHWRVFPVVVVHHLAAGHFVYAVPPVAHEVGVFLACGEHRVETAAILDSGCRGYIFHGDAVESVHASGQILRADEGVGARAGHIEQALRIIVGEVEWSDKRQCSWFVEVGIVGGLMKPVVAHSPERAVAAFVGAIHLILGIHFGEVGTSGIEGEIAVV